MLGEIHAGAPAATPQAAAHISYVLTARNADVRFGSGADMTARLRNVRFTPESRHRAEGSACPLSAKSRHAPKQTSGAPGDVRFVPVSDSYTAANRTIRRQLCCCS